MKQSLIKSQGSVQKAKQIIDPSLNSQIQSIKYDAIETTPLKVIKYIMIALGIVWGMPWIQSCYRALQALNITSYWLQTLLVIFSVCSISIDGIWVMTSNYKLTFRNHQTKLQLRDSYKIQKKLLIISFLIGAISSVPGVYASYTFNSGLKKYLAIIILFGNIGLATFGFYSLIFQIWDRAKSGSNDAGKQFYNNLNMKYFKLLQHYNKNQTYDNVLSEGNYKDLNEFKQIVYSEYDVKVYEKISLTPNLDSVLNIIPLGFGAIIASAQSLIDVILTSNLLTSLTFPLVLSYCLSSVMTIPNLFVSFMSSRQVVTKVITIIRCSPQPRLYHYKKYPYIPYLIIILAMLLSITSPLAGCFITYTTLKQSNINMNVVIIATVTILIARFCFANFTSRSFFTELTSKYTNPIGKQQEQRVQRTFQLISKVHPKYFQK